MLHSSLLAAVFAIAAAVLVVSIIPLQVTAALSNENTKQRRVQKADGSAPNLSKQELLLH
jgi:hypothetical protein